MLPSTSDITLGAVFLVVEGLLQRQEYLYGYCNVSSSLMMVSKVIFIAKTTSNSVVELGTHFRFIHKYCENQKRNMLLARRNKKFTEIILNMFSHRMTTWFNQPSYLLTFCMSGLDI